MLIILTDGIAGIDLSNPAKLSALENLLTAAHYGDHFLLIEPKIIDLLNDKSGDFSVRSRGVIKKARYIFTQFRGIANSIDTKILVTESNGISKNHDGTWLVNIDYFDITSTCYATHLICENLLDCDLYIKLATAYQLNNRLNRSTQIKSENISGGGSSAYCSIEECINSKKICLSVLDSDKLYPNAAICSSTNQCVNLIEQAGWIAVCVATISREIENLIPRRIIENSYKPGDVDLSTLEDFEANDELIESLNYVDFKNGTCLRWVEEKLPANSEAQNYWLGIIQKLVALNAMPDINACVCESMNNCVRKNGTQCSWLFFPSISEHVLSKTVDYLNNRGSNPHKIVREAKGRTEAEWEALGKIIFEWCCSTVPSRV